MPPALFRANTKNLIRRKPMRKLRQLSIAVLLSLMLGAPAFAGIVDCPPAPAPPPSAMATGIVDTPPGDVQPVTPATDPLVDIALNLLQGALSLF
jgi:hypothetical protein